MDRRSFIKTGSILFASILAGCKPTDNNVDSNVPTNPVNKPSSIWPESSDTQPIYILPTAEQPFDLDVFLQKRLGFGPHPGMDLWDGIHATEPNERLIAFLDRQLDPDNIEDSEFEKRFKQTGFQTLHKTLTELGSDHIVHNPYGQNDDRHWEWYILPLRELIKSTYLRATYSQKQLQELLVDFWHNHFNIYAWQDDAVPLFVSYDRDVIRKNIFGNFREFLEDVASHPVMLAYLNNRTNSAAGPNENFARELLELHTLGAENYAGVVDPISIEKDEQGVALKYCDNDVYETARCFTGWRVADDIWEGEQDVGDTLDFLYYRPWHDRFNKFILGRYIPADQPDQADARQVMDLLANHSGTAKYIARKLCRRFIADDPEENLVERIAKVFHENTSQPDQLKKVYRAIFESPEFLASQGMKVKRPFELVISALRGMGAEFIKLPDSVIYISDNMEQPIFGHPQPNGYPDKADDWQSTMVDLYFWNLITGLAENWADEDEDGGKIFVDLAGQTPAELNTARDIIHFWRSRLSLNEINDDGVDLIASVLAGDSKITEPLSIEDLTDRLPAAVELLFMSPSFRYR